MIYLMAKRAVTPTLHTAKSLFRFKTDPVSHPACGGVIE